MISNSVNILTVKTSNVNRLCSKLHQDYVFRPVMQQVFTEFRQTLRHILGSGETVVNGRQTPLPL